FDVQQVINNLTPPVRNNVPTADGSGNVPDGSFVVFDPQALGTMKAISSAYGLNVQVYWCGNPANDRIITCGMYWRGTILGTAPDLTFYDPTTPEVPIMLTNGAAPAAADDAPGGDEEMPRLVAGVDISLRSTGPAYIDLDTGHLALAAVRPSGRATDRLPENLGRIIDMGLSIAGHIVSRAPEMVVFESALFNTAEKDTSAHRRAGLWWSVAQHLHAAGLSMTEVS